MLQIMLISRLAGECAMHWYFMALTPPAVCYTLTAHELNDSLGYWI